MSWDTITPYHHGVREFAEAYDAFGSADIHALPHLPAQPGLMRDVGAGSGRDAEWFATQGWDVVAAEPASPQRRSEGQGAALHPLDCAPQFLLLSPMRSRGEPEGGSSSPHPQSATRLPHPTTLQPHNTRANP